MEGKPPIALVRLLEDIITGRRPDEIVFAFGLVLGQVIRTCADEEDHEEVIEACAEAIRGRAPGRVRALEAPEFFTIVDGFDNSQVRLGGNPRVLSWPQFCTF